MLPINHLHVGSETGGLTLQVSIPSATKCIANTENFYEFIPAKEDPSSWSKIYTVKTYVGRRYFAKPCSEGVLNGMRPSCDDFQKIHEEDKIEKDYEVSRYTVAYSYNGNTEVMCMETYAGPMDSVQVQLTQRLKNDEKVEVVAATLRAELSSMIRVVKFGTAKVK